MTNSPVISVVTQTYQWSILVPVAGSVQQCPSINQCVSGGWQLLSVPISLLEESGEHLRVSSHWKKGAVSLYCSCCLITGRIKRWQIYCRCSWHIHLPGSNFPKCFPLHCWIKARMSPTTDWDGCANSLKCKDLWLTAAVVPVLYIQNNIITILELILHQMKT